MEKAQQLEHWEMGILSSGEVGLFKSPRVGEVDGMRQLTTQEQENRKQRETPQDSFLP